VAKGTADTNDDFYSQAQRAKMKGWKIVALEADHNPQWSATKAFATLLFSNKD
jgi:hypothetical protein